MCAYLLFSPFSAASYMLSFNCFKIVEEAGGAVTCMDGSRFSVFDRSVLVSNGVLHAKVSYPDMAMR